MKKLFWACAGGASLASAGGAMAQLKIGVAGPITGGSAAFGAQLKTHRPAVADINAAGGILGQKLTGEACTRPTPKEGGSVANKFVGDGIKFVVGNYNQLRRHHFCLRGLPGESIRSVLAIRHQPQGHRSAPGECVPHLRSRRPAGRHRRRPHRHQVQGQAGRRHPRQDHRRPGPRRRDAQGHERQGRQGGVLRRRQGPTRISRRWSPSSSRQTPT